MRVLKYLFILLIFSCTSLAVYLLTSRGDFEINTSKETTLSKEEIYQFVSDSTQFSKWNTFGEKCVFHITKKTPYNKIEFQTIDNNRTINHTLTLKENDLGTTIYIKSEGVYSFLEKVENLYKPAELIVGIEYTHLPNNINFELSKLKDFFAISPITLERYLSESEILTSFNKEVNLSIKENAQKQFKLLNNDSISLHFNNLLVNVRKTQENDSLLTINLPIVKQNSLENTEEQWVLKTVLRGDDKFIPKAIQKLEMYANEHQLVPIKTRPTIIQFVVNKETTTNNAEWQTTIWFPVEKVATTNDSLSFN